MGDPAASATRGPPGDRRAPLPSAGGFIRNVPQRALLVPTRAPLRAYPNCDSRWRGYSPPIGLPGFRGARTAQRVRFGSVCDLGRSCPSTCRSSTQTRRPATTRTSMCGAFCRCVRACAGIALHCIALHCAISEPDRPAGLPAAWLRQRPLRTAGAPSLTGGMAATRARRWMTPCGSGTRPAPFASSI